MKDRENMAGSTIRYIVMAILATVLLGKSEALSMEQVRQAGKMMRNSCLPKTGVSADVVEAASKGQFDADDRKLKCYIKCVMGMMQSVKNGKYNPDAAIGMARKMLPDGVGGRTAAAIEKCRVEWDKYEDACDASYAVTACTYAADPEVRYGHYCKVNTNTEDPSCSRISKNECRCQKQWPSW